MNFMHIVERAWDTVWDKKLFMEHIKIFCVIR